MPASPSTSLSSDSDTLRFRFRPRYKLFALGMIALGAVFVAAPLVRDFGGSNSTVSMAIGAVSALLGLLYLLSPAWRIVVVVDDQALEVLSRGDRRFRVPWSEVAGVVASPETKTLYFDGGEPDRSFKVPGRGAPAPYDIERRTELYDAIMARVPAEVVTEVELLEAK